MKRRLRSVAGAAAAGASLWLAFSGVELHSLTAAFAAADARWLAVAVLSVFLTLGFVVVRLRLLASAWTVNPPFRLMWHVTIVGQVANIVVPFRLGDGIKILSGSRRLGLQPLVVGAMVAVERLLDALALALATALLLIVGSAPGWTRPVLVSASVVGFVIVAIGLAVTKWIGSADTAVPPFGTGRIRAFAARQIELIRAGLAAVSAPRVRLRLLLGSAAIISGSALTNLLTMRAFDLQVPATSALLLLVLVQSGNALAAAPGGIGVSQLVAVETLGLWDVPPATALACSLALFIVVRLPKIAMLPAAMAALAEARPAPEVPVKL